MTTYIDSKKYNLVSFQDMTRVNDGGLINYVILCLPWDGLGVGFLHRSASQSFVASCLGSRLRFAYQPFLASCL